ncbi:glycosidase [Arthrobacter sp. FW305-BF8]|uniref:pullulanase X25 domain-containing protein n=1 Tax=Arthrobacter sp. FW305-BF8 TaxID=2879617 RepID=UPI001F341DF1|nr:glycosidase [Arthrobacter sp. FW305-BF8]UKA55403.1 glycosidase [Arthrobacter sp. FW305-BF8]
MRKTAAENTNIRLKAVLDVLAEGVLSGDSQNAGAVLAEALVRVPLNAYEAELLSGGIPRGHKSLTTATSKLVKAGWLVKGRSGWTITEDGQRATVAFPDAASFSAALDAGTPVPVGTPLPVAAPAKPAAAEAAPAEAEKAPSKAAKVVDKAAKLIEDAVAPVAKAVRKKAEADAEAQAPAVENSTETIEQPAAVAVAGDFNTLLGAPENWAPQYDEAQMKLDELDQLWKISAEIPAGYYNFKIALNRSWDENYGAFGAFDGANHELHHSGGQLTIRYNHRTRDITVN